MKSIGRGLALSLVAAGAIAHPHFNMDVTPGDGKLEGKAVLTLHLGTLFLAGALS
jgi:hypothetical protein